MIDLMQWVALTIASLVSLLTLYNAARLKTGVLAMSTYAFGGGMLFLAAGFFLLNFPLGVDLSILVTMYRTFFLIGFILLGWGSWQIYQMSRIK